MLVEELVARWSTIARGAIRPEVAPAAEELLITFLISLGAPVDEIALCGHWVFLVQA